MSNVKTRGSPAGRPARNRHAVWSFTLLTALFLSACAPRSPTSIPDPTVTRAPNTVAPTPTRARQAEAVLIGRAPTQEALKEAAERSVEAIAPISDMRASAAYRRELVKILTRRALERTCEALGLRDGNLTD